MNSNPRTIEVPCTVEIEQSQESLHAHVDLDLIDIGPGDEVLVHEAPLQVSFGERRVFNCRATVVRASTLGRLRAKLEGYLEITELYEVGFSRS
jgi:hypothetical protein